VSGLGIVVSGCFPSFDAPTQAPAGRRPSPASLEAVLRPPLAVALAALTVLGGCGGGGAKREQQPRAVRLTITSPADAAMTRGAQVEVTGRVWPARARVVVAGRRAKVASGRFRAAVALREGANVVDVGASAPRSTAAWSAVRIIRQTLVTVPDLVGALRDDAVSELEARGLKPAVTDRDGVLRRLLPGDSRVCATGPEAGADVRAGSAVDLLVSKGC
jgi:hypothetical protein